MKINGHDGVGSSPFGGGGGCSDTGLESGLFGIGSFHGFTQSVVQVSAYIQVVPRLLPSKSFPICRSSALQVDGVQYSVRHWQRGEVHDVNFTWACCSNLMWKWNRRSCFNVFSNIHENEIGPYINLPDVALWCCFTLKWRKKRWVIRVTTEKYQHRKVTSIFSKPAFDAFHWHVVTLRCVFKLPHIIHL